MIETCGIFIFSKNNKLLICRATNSNNWSIPKGQKDLNESNIETAIRECFEETNLALEKEHLIYIGEEIYKSKKKKLIAFIYKFPINEDVELKCNSFFNETIPEIAEFSWAESPSNIHQAQIVLFPKAFKKFKSNNSFNK
jgi:ADP-ribose pyrophosphatase YjhB (NUDIX family)